MRMPLVAVLVLVLAWAASIKTSCNPMHEQFNIPLKGSPDQVKIHRDLGPERKRSVNGLKETIESIKHNSKRSYDFDESDFADLEAAHIEWIKQKIINATGIKRPEDIEVPNSIPSEHQKLIDEHHARHSLSQELHNPRQKRFIKCPDGPDPRAGLCCLYRFYVDFSITRWSKFIISPRGFYANMCLGHCDMTLARYHHTLVMDRIVGDNHCCTPKHLSNKTLLFWNAKNAVEEKNVDTMVAQDCDCG